MRPSHVTSLIIQHIFVDLETKFCFAVLIYLNMGNIIV